MVEQVVQGEKPGRAEIQLELRVNRARGARQQPAARVVALVPPVPQEWEPLVEWPGLPEPEAAVQQEVGRAVVVWVEVVQEEPVEPELPRGRVEVERVVQEAQPAQWVLYSAPLHQIAPTQATNVLLVPAMQVVAVQNSLVPQPPQPHKQPKIAKCESVMVLVL